MSTSSKDYSNIARVGCIDFYNWTLRKAKKRLGHIKRVYIEKEEEEYLITEYCNGFYSVVLVNVQLKVSIISIGTYSLTLYGPAREERERVYGREYLSTNLCCYTVPVSSWFVNVEIVIVTWWAWTSDNLFGCHGNGYLATERMSLLVDSKLE